MACIMNECTTPTRLYKPLQQRTLHLSLQCTQLHPLAGKLLLQRHIVLLLTRQLLLQVCGLLLQVNIHKLLLHELLCVAPHDAA